MVVLRHDLLVGGCRDGERVPQSMDPNITQIVYGMSSYSLREVEVSGQKVEFWADDELLLVAAVNRLLLYYRPRSV